MGFRLVAILLIASVCGAQTPTPAAPAPNPSEQPATITVPQGTTVALTLVSPIKSKSTRPGDAVRAIVAFPVTVGSHVAIPAGTYVQGTVNSISPHPTHGRGPSVKIHLTNLLFSNGYLAALDATNTDALMTLPGSDAQGTVEIADARSGAPFLGENFHAALGQTMPTPPPLPPQPQVGPSKAVVIGAGVAASVVILALTLGLAHHHANAMDFVVFDDGWQFAMVLSQPVTLDAVRVNLAVGQPAER